MLGDKTIDFHCIAPVWNQIKGKIVSFYLVTICALYDENFFCFIIDCKSMTLKTSIKDKFLLCVPGHIL